MQTESKSFDIRGGLDQETTALKIAPGRIIAALNHEMQPNGVQRTEGFERFDGHPAPSAAEFFAADLVHLDTSVATHYPPVAGETVIGNTSGATARVLETVLVAGVGQRRRWPIALHLITGTFQLGERLLSMIAGVPTPVLYLDSVPASGDWRESDSALGWLVAAQTYARNLITAVPGSGPVRGVLWFADKLNAWRDNAAATLGVLYHSRLPDGRRQILARKSAFTRADPISRSPAMRLSAISRERPRPSAMSRSTMASGRPPTLPAGHSRQRDRHAWRRDDQLRHAASLRQARA
jgi:hypothetical protein